MQNHKSTKLCEIVKKPCDGCYYRIGYAKCNGKTRWIKPK